MKKVNIAESKVVTDTSKLPQELLDKIGKTVEFISDVIEITVEQLTDQKFRFQTVGSIANVINGNQRVIPMTVQRDAVSEWLTDKWQLTAYEEHPMGDIRGSMKELAGTCEIVALNEAGETLVNISLLPTKDGDHVKVLFDSKVKLGTSQRALGIQSVREDVDGNYFIVVDKIVKILGYDFCLLESAAAGDRTQIRLLDTIEVDRIVNLSRIEDNYKEEEAMLKPQELQALVEANGKLVEAVSKLVDTIQAQTKEDTQMSTEIVDTFASLRTGVEGLKADETMDPETKNQKLLQITADLKAIVDMIIPAPTDAEAAAQASAGVDTTATATTDVTALTDRIKLAVEKQVKQKNTERHITQMAAYLTDKITRLDLTDDAKTQILDSLKTKSFESTALIDTHVEQFVKMLNLGVAQERLKQEGLAPKGQQVMDIKLAPEHLKGVEIIADQLMGTGKFQSTTKDNLLVGKDRRPTVREFLRVYDQIHGMRLAEESAKIQALVDATTTPADFQIPYTISRLVLEEVYSDYMIESLTDFGPMTAKRDQIPITRYRREGGLTTTQFTNKASKKRQSELKVAEFGKIPKGKLTTEWFNIDATPTKLAASFSDEFMTLSKRYSNITGVSQGIANLIADLKRSLQQMVFTEMRNAALAYGSVAFTYNGVGNGTATVFTASSGASISPGETLTVTVDAVAINEFEVSTSGTMFYILDAQNGKVAFVDADGAPSAPANTKAVVVGGKKATNETRFSLTPAEGVAWEKHMNKLLFAVSNTAAAHRQTRGYKPDFMLASEVTSNYLTQAEAYASSLNRSGMEAGSVKGEGNYGRSANLPHFGSDVWDDSFILISKRDSTIFRIFEPLAMKGPYPVRDGDGALIGGEEYYLYQEDALKTPLPEKSSLITVVA
ncbi:MAG: hypothetical protein V1799_07500 [bacterium]